MIGEMWMMRTWPPAPPLSQDWQADENASLRHVRAAPTHEIDHIPEFAECMLERVEDVADGARMERLAIPMSGDATEEVVEAGRTRAVDASGKVTAMPRLRHIASSIVVCCC